MFKIGKCLESWTKYYNLNSLVCNYIYPIINIAIFDHEISLKEPIWQPGDLNQCCWHQSTVLLTLRPSRLFKKEVSSHELSNSVSSIRPCVSSHIMTGANLYYIINNNLYRSSYASFSETICPSKLFFTVLYLRNSILNLAGIKSSVSVSSNLNVLLSYSQT